MADKVIEFNNSVNRYVKLSDERVDKGDLIGSLGFLFSAYKNDKNNLKILSLIADTYSDMGLPELSNAYWFKYLDCAGLDKVSLAYEQLAINYFYMDNLLASGYYFHQKSLTDGFISAEGLEQDVLDFISEISQKKESYFIAYPFDKADYSYRAKNAKRALANGDVKTAKYIYSTIPKECMTEDISGELAISCFLAKEDDEVKRVCKESIEKNGDNVTAYCNLSTVYKSENNDEKSAYYYAKALASRKGVRSEAYKLATCAIEQEDHLTVSDCVSKILEERPNDAVMNLFYSMSLINTNKTENACEVIKLCRKIDPYNCVYEYYADLYGSILNGDKNAIKLLPLKYELEIPKEEIKERKKIIKKMMLLNTSSVDTMIKSDQVKKILRWGLKSSDKKIAQDSVFLTSTSKYMDNELLLSLLLEPGISEEVKRVIIYSLILNGKKSKFGIVMGNFYVKIKPRKLLCEKKKNGELFLSAYAIAMARMSFLDVKDRDKLAFAIDKLYVNGFDKILERNLLPEQIATIAVIKCRYEVFKSDKEICGYFGVKYSDIEDFIKGEI